MKAIIYGLILLLVGGCSLIAKKSQTHKSLQFEKRWVRSTLLTNYLGHRIVHRFTPIVLEDKIIQGNGVDGIVAYDRVNGYKLWSLKIVNGVEAGAVVSGSNLLFAAGDGQFYSVNINNGHIRWTFPIQSEGIGAPTLANGVVYFIAGNNIAYALTADDGRQVWLYNRTSPSNLSIRGTSQPNVVDGHVYMGFNDGYFVSVNARDGRLNWEKQLNNNARFQDVDAYPVIENGKIYISSFDGALYCLNQSTGKVLWSVDEGGYSAVAINKSKLFYSTTTGKVMALDKSSGKTIWSYDHVEGVAGPPTYHESMIIFGESDGAIKVLDESSGQLLTSFNTGRGVTSGSFIDHKTGDLFFISKEANLYSMNLKWREQQEALPWDKSSH